MNRLVLRTHNKIVNFIIVFSPIILTSIISGCFPGPLITWTKDVSQNKDLWGGYKYNGLYTLKVDAFLRIRKEIYTPNKNILVPPRVATKGIYNLHYSAPESVDSYKGNVKKWPDVAGIVKAGTTIKCVKLIKYNPLGYGSSLYLEAEILYGPFAGQLAEITDLSLSKKDKKTGMFFLSPNPKLLSFEK